MMQTLTTITTTGCRVMIKDYEDDVDDIDDDNDDDTDDNDQRLQGDDGIFVEPSRWPRSGWEKG